MPVAEPPPSHCVRQAHAGFARQLAEIPPLRKAGCWQQMDDGLQHASGVLEEPWQRLGRERQRLDAQRPDVGSLAHRGSEADVWRAHVRRGDLVALAEAAGLTAEHVGATMSGAHVADSRGVLGDDLTMLCQ